MDEHTIKFKSEHIDFLLNNIKNTNVKLKCLNARERGRIYKERYPTNSFIASFSNAEIELLIDELTELLSELGFNFNYKLNRQGSMIEDIIDLLMK